MAPGPRGRTRGASSKASDDTTAAAAAAANNDKPNNKRKKPNSKKKPSKNASEIDFSIDEESGHWIPIYEDPEALADRPYVARVEVAKSGRATCRLCCEKIDKATPKVGLPMKWQGGKNPQAATFGWATSWCHPKCCRVKNATEKTVHGIGDLAPKDAKFVLSEISRTDTPETLKELRPEDVDALVPQRVLEERDPPSTLSQELLPFQKEGLGWMLDQEEGEVRGGILADEMGMGKTIQTISLLLASKEKEEEDEERSRKRRRLSLTKLKAKLKASKASSSTTPAGTCPATLIIVPTSALMQWAEEIKTFTAPGALSCFIYYGDRSEVKREDFYKHDIVITTYPVVEIEYRKVVDTLKVCCEYCGKMLLPRTLYVHQRYFCGPDAVKTERLQKREKKQKETNEKAMRTLRIKGKKEYLPTPMGVYKEYMDEAERAKIPMFAKGSSADPATTALAKEAFASKDVCPPIPQTPEEGENEEEKAKSPKGGKRSPKGKKRVKKEEEDPDFVVDLTQVKDEEEDDEEDEVEVVKVETKAKGKAKGKGKAKAKAAPAAAGKKKTASPLKAWEENFQEIEVAEQLKDQNQKLAESSLLHGTHWNRLILDEAHKIKARTTSVAKSVYSLKSDKKWCLTGTPLQNRVGELYSLLRFLELDPFAYYFCRKKGCDCKSLHWNFGPKQKACTSCGCPSPYHYSHFNRTILNPITRFGYLGEGKKAVIELKTVLNNVQLRRTKKGRAEDVKLPPLEITVVETALDEREKDFYDSLYKETQVKFDAYVKKGTLLHNYAHIFELLSRLRQAVNHPFLVIHGNEGTKGVIKDAASEFKKKGEEVGAGAMAEAEQRSLCGICAEEVSAEDVTTSEKCGHEFHRTCMLQYVMALPPGGKLKCPVCFQAMTIDLSETEERRENRKVLDSASLPKAKTKATAKPKKSSILSKIDTKSFQSSSKIESLMESVLEMQKKGAEHKGIIFSQYTRMLDIVEWRIQKLGIKTVKMVGSMPIMMRRSMLEAFKKDKNVKLLLLSLKAGGEGLNLQAASHVFVLEPWWNPAVEMQAIQRAHRIGQTKPVTAVRYFTKGTIEERMMQLQDKKKLVFEGTIDNNIESLTRLNTEDIRFLFS